ncbi:hypothetical protein N9383_06710 [Granulosicoccus sp.]|nr:hypothetical protein [Granulosicoccus sp.]
MSKSEKGVVEVGSKVWGALEENRYEGRIKVLTGNTDGDPDECFATVELDVVEQNNNSNKLRVHEEITVPLSSLKLLSDDDPMSYWFGYRVSESGGDSKPGIWQPDGPYDSQDKAMIKQSGAHEPDMQISEIFQAKSHAEAFQYLQCKS